MTKLPTLNYVAAMALGVTLAFTTACNSEKPTPRQLDTKTRTFPRSVANDNESNTSVTAPDLVAEPAPLVPEPILEPVVPEPKTFSEFVAAGKKAHRNGDFADSILLLEQAARKKPNHATPIVHMARAYLELGQIDEARSMAEKAVEINPSSSFSWNTLGRVELAEGDSDAAIASFTRATDENEDNSYAWNNLGYVLIGQENFEEAAEALENATSGSNPTAYMWNNLGMAYEHLDMISEARAAYRQASDIGSLKAEASLERLEGVVSLVPSDEEDLIDEDSDSDDGPIEGEVIDEEGFQSSVDNQESIIGC